MSLVAYGSSSDESDEETSAKKPEPIPKSKKQKVKIAIPSLKEFETDENEIPQKKPKFQSGSGLLGLLPPPKNSSSSTLCKPGFVPHVLKSKKEEKHPSLKKSETVKKEPETSSIPNPVEHDSDDEPYEKDKSSNEANSIDFFSLDDSKKENVSLSKYTAEASVSETSGNHTLSYQSLSSELQYSSSRGVQHSYFENEPNNISYSQELYQQSPLINEPHTSMDYSLGYPSESTDSSGLCAAVPAVEPDTKELLLNDEGFLRLQGRRQKLENVDIIDVNGAELLTDKNQWLMKSLTEETTHRPSRKKHDMPTQQQKRKHQITYLAFQAKEREMDLKNQWSMNSRTRRETQAKYGF